MTKTQKEPRVTVTDELKTKARDTNSTDIVLLVAGMVVASSVTLIVVAIRESSDTDAIGSLGWTILLGPVIVIGSIILLLITIITWLDSRLPLATRRLRVAAAAFGILSAAILFAVLQVINVSHS